MLQSYPPHKGLQLQPVVLQYPFPEHSRRMTASPLAPLICRELGQAGMVQFGPVHPGWHWLSPKVLLASPGGLLVVFRKTS
jgi:hypothetical protein